MLNKSTGSELTLRHENWIIFSLIMLFPLLGMGIDLISPSLPAIKAELHISANMAKNLVTVYLAGSAIGNLIIGIWSDTFGRRKLLLGGLMVFPFASLLPVVVPGVYTLFIARFVQGLSLSAVSVLSRAIFSDILSPERLLRIAVFLSMAWGIGPIIGPFIGGYLQDYFGWKACFYFFAVFSGIGYLSLVFHLPETLKKSAAFSFKQVAQNLIQILSHPIFLGAMLVMGFGYALLISFNILAPFLIQGVFGKSAVFYGDIALLLGCCYLIGSFICKQLLKVYTHISLLPRACCFALFVALVMAALACFNNKSMLLLVGASMLLFASVGILYPLGMGLCMSLFRNVAGSAASMMTFVSLLIVGGLSYLISFISVKSILGLALINCALVLCCFLSCILCSRGAANNAIS